VSQDNDAKEVAMSDTNGTSTTSEQTNAKWQLFEQCRDRLHRVAMRIVGSADDADDIVQDASLRWMRADLGSVRAPEGWMITVVTRLAVDHTRRVARQRRVYDEAAQADAIMASASAATDPDESAASRTPDAFALLRYRLAPAERLAFMLREVFGCEYAEVARELRKSEVACRQIVHRARTRLREPVCSIAASRHDSRKLAESLARALEAGDRRAVLAELNQPGEDRPRAHAKRLSNFAKRLDRTLDPAA
jgi:RNA polymerase sigma-70 factor, ECF subfamily